MIGLSFSNTCSERHIAKRCGDGNGKPFPGPLVICPVSVGALAVLTKDKYIYIRSIRGVSEHVYYPLSAKASILNRRASLEQKESEFASALVKKSTEEEDWQAQFLKKTGDSGMGKVDFDYDEDEHSTPYSFIDVQPTNICKVVDQNALCITDSRFCVHILNLDTHELAQSFGSAGRGVGEFAYPSAITTLGIPMNPACELYSKRLFYFVGDSKSNQKVRVFDQELIQIAELGELGPALGQFRDITSISSFDPNSNKYSNKNTVEVTNVDAFVEENSLPAWYRGVQCFEDLEEMLYDEAFTGNFLVAQRKRRTFLAQNNNNGNDQAGEDGGEDSDVEELPRTSTLSRELNNDIDEQPHSDHMGFTSTSSLLSHSHANDGDDGNEGYDSFDREEEDEEEAMGGVFDVLFISNAKKLDHLLVKENKNPAFEPGFYISNSLSPVRETFPCVFDLLRAQKQSRFTLGGDRRRYVYVAICDQGNYRVQVFRFYWTNNFMFRPELQLAYVIGGAEKRYVELFDPLSVAYTLTGNF